MNALIILLTAVLGFSQIPINPISRNIKKEEFKHVQFRNIAASSQYSPIVYLTRPDLSDSNFQLQQLTPLNQRKLQALKSEFLRGTVNPSPIKEMFDSLTDELKGVDIDSLIAWLMMEIARESNQEMRALIQDLKKTKESQKALREKIQNLTELRIHCQTKPQSCTFVKRSDIDAAVDRAKDSIDSLSELSEMESLRLQMAMNRMSKLMSTLSNILKKSSETAQAIVQNLK